MSTTYVTPIPATKYLDYAGLVYYDEKVKAWVNSLGIPLGVREKDGIVEVDKSVIFNTPVTLKGNSVAENLTVSGDVKLLEVATGYSDSRLKTDIRDLGSVIERISNLSVCRYRPNEIAQSAGVEDREEIGLIADEVAEVFPELIKISPVTDILNSVEEYKTIDYARMSAILVKAIQELNVQYESRFSSLEKRLIELESK